MKFVTLFGNGAFHYVVQINTKKTINCITQELEHNSFEIKKSHYLVKLNPNGISSFEQIITQLVSGIYLCFKEDNDEEFYIYDTENNKFEDISNFKYDINYMLFKLLKEEYVCNY